jgi:hypothetical protein
LVGKAYFDVARINLSPRVLRVDGIVERHGPLRGTEVYPITYTAKVFDVPAKLTFLGSDSIKHFFPTFEFIVCVVKRRGIFANRLQRHIVHETVIATMTLTAMQM